MNRLLLRDLWDEVKGASRRAQHIEAAIAYVTDSGAMAFKDGDLLAVDASDGAIRGGETSAEALVQLYRKGVRIYNVPGLHAKVTVMDGTCVVGSANASVMSRDILHEAAVMTDSPRVVAQALSFIYQLTQGRDPIGEPDIRRLRRIKVTRRHATARPDAGRKKAAGGSTWAVAVTEMNPEQYERELGAISEAEAAVRTKSDHPSWVRFVSQSKLRREARNGDLLIVASKLKGQKVPCDVAPPSSILLRQDRAPWTRFYYDPQLALPFRRVTWREFGALCRKADVRAPTGNMERLLSPDEADRLFEAWPRAGRKQTK